jgi:phosphoenolpyruvate-protein kinase (PTS system EI component)
LLVNGVKQPDSFSLTGRRTRRDRRVIILEIGGMLQHGALVAREYGKSCVSGIEGAALRLRDDQSVEVNGRSGVVSSCWMIGQIGDIRQAFQVGHSNYRR